MFRKILIANRGEIACRIIGTARRMGIATVAVYSEADTEALHVRMADEAIGIGPAPSADSYLNIKRIVEACRQSGALIQQGASNYSKAEAASTLGGGAGVLEAPPEPPKITPPGPPGTWGKGEPPPLEEVLKTMRERVGKFNVEKIRPQDLAGAAGPPDEGA